MLMYFASAIFSLITEKCGIIKNKCRAMKNFEKFFEDMPSDSLSAVIAVAMDMNASYNKLVTKHLPKAQIVYDRFHMQSQFGRDVLGVVRLDEARRLKAKEKEILADISDDTDKETMKSLKQEAMLVITY